MKEAKAREGFFFRGELDAVLRYLPADLRPVVLFGYITGWRSGEIKQLTWAQVDSSDGDVRLDPGTSKNGEGRTFPFTPELRTLLETQREETTALQKKKARIIDRVFHRDDEPINTFYGSWKTACTKAGVPGRLFHDCRRTSVRNLERSGVSRSVAMQMVGHKTEAIYRRYAIVNRDALLVAAAKLAQTSAADITAAGTGTIAGTVTPIKARAASIGGR